MRIASKINAALFAAFAGGTIATYAVLQSTIAPRFEALEREAAETNHKRVTDAFHAFTEKLATASQDYAFWDETYRFMNGEKQDEFVASNLQPEFKAVSNLGVNALAFLRKDGTVQWGAAFDLESEEPIEGMIKEIAHFAYSHAYIANSNPEAERGIIRTSKGLMLIAIAPVLKSDQSGEPNGKVVAAKMLDVDAAAKLTNVAFVLEPYVAIKAAGLPEDMGLNVDADKIETVSVLKSLVGRPLALIKASTPRDISKTGSAAISSALWMMTLAGTLAIGILWMFLARTVVARLTALKHHFATAGNSGKIRQTEFQTNADEIGDLARSFNGMADQVNHLRDALADGAYMSGLSEWAAGTLHNVRNGLAPVAASTWQVEKLFEEPWLKNVEMAAAEHASEATPPERRQKLNAYLVASSARFLDTAKRATELTGHINKASGAILDMVTEFERYAHKKMEPSPVAVGDAVKSVVETTLQGRSGDIDVTVPATAAVVSCNDIILRQVLSNVLINAIEACDANGINPKIAVSVSEVSGTGRVSIAMTDNGEGLSSDRLQSVFKRGESTRTARTGGLGLHWCANAVKVFDGSIRAESPGLGMGTTFIIELPAHGIAKQEAA